MSHRLAVLDASAALRVVLGQEGPKHEIAGLLETARLVIAPELFVCEVTNALWKYVAHGDIDRDRALEHLEQCLALLDARISSRELAEEALVAAEEYQHPAYDMFYAVLARRHGGIVLSVDRRFRAVLDRMSIACEPTNR